MPDTLDNKIDLQSNPEVEKTTEEPIVQEKPKRKFPKKILKVLGIVLLVILFLGLILGLLVGRPGWQTFVSAQEALRQAKEVNAALKEQDLTRAKEETIKTKDKLKATRDSFQKMAWLGSLPLLGNYWHDGDHLLNAGLYGLEGAEMALTAIIPHADIIGFEGEPAEGEVLSVEDKILRVLKSLKEIRADLDQIEEKLKLAEAEIAQIDENRYPNSLRGIAVREKVVFAKEMVGKGTEFLGRIKPLIEVLPELLGGSEERKYLVLFQNDAELRPTGGFMTAYTILRADEGEVRAYRSSDIYDLDGRFGKYVPAPAILKKYLKSSRWHLRDMNLSPDFKVSMETFRKYFETIPGEKVVGIITVDTKVLKDLLDIIGEIHVGGYGNFSSENDERCQCPNVIYEMELLADRPLGALNPQRKAVLGPMMQEVLLRALGLPKDQWPTLFEKVFELIEEKHVLFYLYDEEEQKALEAFGGAGRIKDYPGDYLHINDANFGGAKSNLYITHEVEQQIEVQDGKIIKTINLTYRNPEEPSNCDLEAGELCLNGPCPTWVRVYVPAGAKLLESSGSEIEVETKEELGKTVFESLVTIRPKGIAKLSFKVELPSEFKTEGSLKMLIQKQPGKDKTQHILVVNGQEQELEVSKDREVEIKL